MSTTVVPSSTLSVDSDYPLTNLQDLNPVEVTRWTDKTALRLVWDAGGPITMEGLLIVMHTMLASSTLKVQANTSDSWVTPDFSMNVTVPAWAGDDNLMPPNILVNLIDTTCDTVGYRYYSLLIPAHASVNHAIGEISWVTSWQTPTSSIAWPVQRFEVRRISINSTAYGVDHIVDRGVRQRRLRLDFRSISDTDRNLLLGIVREVGAAKAFVIMLDVDEATDFHASAEGMLGRFTQDSVSALTETLQFFGVHDISLEVLEVQRGLAL